MNAVLQAKRDRLAAVLKTRSTYADLCVHQLFEQRADQTPDKLALVSEATGISYAALESRANQLAHHLIGLGAGPDMPVGIYLHRGPDVILSLLAVLKAGAAYVMLDPAQPAHRIGQILESVQAPVVLTTEALLGALPSVWTQIVCLDSEWPAIARHSASRPPAIAKPTNVAYILYTSGSTGAPKGVAVEHRNIANYASAVAERIGLADDSYAVVSTFGADLGNTTVFGSLCQGGTLHVIGAETARDSFELAGYFERHAVDVLKITPSHLGMMLGAVPDASVVPLKTLVLGGEQSEVALVAECQQLRPDCAIWNHYGPTETAVGVLTQPLSPGLDTLKSVALGRPLANTQVYVLDEFMEPVRAGLGGELYIGGANVARGYWGQPGITADRFVPDHLGARLGARLYRTGDLVRWLADGTLEFLGRADEQIKLRGFRIEPGEIETALREEMGIVQARVILREDTPGEPKLAAYIVASEADFDAARLRTALAAKLPDYMVPAALVRLDALPLTANGKLDRRALPVPEERAVTDEDDAPRTAVEEILAGIWAEVLRVAHVGRHANFFELGGHSLLATQVVSRIRVVTGAELPLQAMFDQKSLMGLAGEVEQAMREERRTSAPPLTAAAGDGRDTWPLSFAQQRLWFIDQLSPGGSVYNIPTAIRLQGELDVAALQRTVDEIVRRHAILRTTIQTVDGQPVQHIAPPKTVPIPIADLEGLPCDGTCGAAFDTPCMCRENAARSLAAEEADRSFDLARGPLLRCQLLRLAEQDHVLLVTLHHIVTDAWSSAIVVRELKTLYEAYASGGESPLPELAVQYADYAVWQRSWLQGEALERQMAYWRTQLAGLSPLELPTDHPRRAVPSGSGAVERFTIEPELSGQLRGLSRQSGATLFMTLLAAWQVLLSRYTHQTDIVVGSPVANRNHAETEALIGFFVNTLVLRTDLSAGDDTGASSPTFAELLERVRTVALAAYGHQDIPFEQLVDELQPKRDLSRHPLFQVMLAVQNAAPGTPALKDLSLSYLDSGHTTAKFDLMLNITDTPQGLMGGIEYAADLFEQAAITRMIGHFSNLLEGVVSNPGLSLHALPLLGEAERRQLLTEFCGVRSTYPADACVHEIFERQAERTPGAVAVSFGDQSVPYAELNARANQLARYLEEQGVGPDMRAGLMVARSVEMVVCLLAILKAGGAYVPLDPDYPAERLAFMLADADAKLLITQENLRVNISHGAFPLPLANPSGSGAMAVALDSHAASDSRSETQPGNDRVNEPTSSPLPVICIDTIWDSLANYSSENRPTEAKPANLAYVIYTSGSTGRPKGAAITHQSIVRLVVNTNYITISERDIVLQLASVSFDASTLEIWGALLNGATLAVYPPTMPTLDELGAFIASEGISLLWLTARLFDQMVDHSLDSFKGVRQLLAGGEALSPPHVRRAVEALPQCRIINGYGPTENTTFTACHWVEDAEAIGTTVPIGRAIANTSVSIVDGNLQPVPIGVPGELLTGGDGLARGYLNDAALTAERFVPDPFSDVPGRRLYRTGDLAKFRPDGAIEYLGRLDQQVKVRGYRIELGEIEAALAGHPSIAAAVAVVREDAGTPKRLVAYISARDGSEIDTADLRSFLASRLPEYMIPAVFAVLESLPLTANGKVDRAALPAPQFDPMDADATPRTPVEAALARLWADVLGIPRVGIHDNFFSIGGDSILSIQIVARANQAGITLTPRMLFQHQTIAQLAAVAGTVAGVEADQGAVTGAIPLTPIQHWFFDRKLAEPHHFNQSVLLETDPRLRPDVLRQAVSRLISHHDALRIQFTQTPDGWTAFNDADPDASSVFEVTDLASRDTAGQRAMIEQACAELQAGFDLAGGALVTFRYFDLGPDLPGRLFAVAHHLVIDGVSWRILLEDLQLACAQGIAGQAIALPPKTTSFQRWSEELHRYADLPDFKSEAAYWNTIPWSQAKPLPVEATVDGPGRALINTTGSTHSVTESLSIEQTRALLQEAPAKYHTQINDILLAALAAAVCRWAHDDHLLIALEGHGREDISTGGNTGGPGVDISRTAGWFTSLFPVLLRWTPEMSPQDLLVSTKETLRAIPGRGLGYGLLRYLSADADMLEIPEPEVSFNYLGQFDQTLPDGGLFRVASENAGPGHGPLNARPRLIDVSAMVGGGRLHITVTYSRSLHGEESMQSLARDYVRQLEGMVTHCIQPGVGAFTPSDFPDVKLEFVQLALITTLLGETAPVAIYPLSPMQQGMLFHTLYAPGAGEYVAQNLFDLSGEIDISAFQEAWRRIVDHHDILRTAFFWDGLAEPVQAVCEHADVGVTVLDWSTLSATGLERELTLLRRRDATDDFDLMRAPLMRFTLIRTGPGRFRLLWTHHHLLLDGWCIPVLFREFIARYKANVRGESYHVERAVPYREYIQWLVKQDMARAESYWRETLAQFAEPTPLPEPGVRASLGGDDAAAFADRHAERLYAIDGDLSAACRDFVQRTRITLSTLMQGVWSVILGRYSGREDVVFGATVSGRPPAVPGIETMLGLFINTLPVRVRLPGEETVAGWLGRLQAAHSDRSEYEYSPLTAVQGWSGVPRGLPLFESLLVFENFPSDPNAVNESGRAIGLNVESVQVNSPTNYPIAIDVVPGDRIVLRFHYHRERYDGDAIDRLAAQWRTLLSQITASAPDARVGDLSLLTDAERRHLLFELNDTATSDAPYGYIHHCFERQAEATPEAVAVAFDGGTLTYAELNTRANQLAHHLKRRHVGPEVRVGLMIERSPDMVAAVLGVLKAGAAYVPLDPELPAERLAFIVADASLEVIVTQRKWRENVFLKQARAVVRIDQDWDEIAQSPGENPDVDISGQNLAYIIYTSGSTGTPKGVGVCHSGLANYVAWSRQAYDVSSGDGSPVHSALNFDLTITSLFPALVSGQRVVLLPERQPNLELRRMLGEDADWTLFKITPAHLAVLREGLRSERAAGGVRSLVIGGEALYGSDLAFWRERWPGLRLINEYGPTETVVGCCVYEVGETVPGGVVPIGRPIWNTDLYVLDGRMRPVPAGVSGELYIGGAGLARGYVGSPELTAERFVPHPFSSAPGARLYRSGDICRYLDGGNLEYLGRADHQVKIRGFRIELGEIEAALSQFPEVAMAAVVVRADGPGDPDSNHADKRLVAYVAPSNDGRIDIPNLRSFLETRLPEYMIPPVFVVLDALPLSTNGKVDRAALPVPEEHGFHLDSAELRTPVEELVAMIWSQVLRVDRIRRADSFFALGGHSLLATRVISRIRAVIGVEVPLSLLFEAPVLAEFAVRLEDLRRGSPELQAPPITRRSRDEAWPLSFAQQRLWFIDKVDPDSVVYNIPIAIKLTGPLNTGVLERTINEIARRHEVLRTTFPMAGARPVQAIHPHEPFTLSITSVEHAPAAERDAIARELAQREAARPFDLAAGPLMCVSLLRLGEWEHVVLLTMHHIISDAWSMGLLVDEVVALYEAFSANRPSPLPELPIQYADFSVWQREWLQGDVLERQLGYWKQQLAGLPVLEMPVDHPRPPVQSYRGDRIDFAISAELTHALADVCAREGVTLFMTLLAAWQLLLARYSGQDDIVVGTPIAGRNRAETEALIGFFVNTLVLRTDLSGNPAFGDVLGRVRAMTLAAYTHQDIPFEQLVEEISPERDLSRHPLYQVMISLQNTSMSALTLKDLTLSRVSTGQYVSKIDLAVMFTEVGERLAGSIDYATDLFDRPTVERMAEHLQNLIARIIISPGRGVFDLPFLSEAEEHQLLVTFNETPPAQGDGLLVHESFERLALETPDATALAFESEQVSYGELSARSSQLAHYLTSLGVGPEAIVGLCVERSVEMVVCLLGILKAGGAYVPLDPEYPDDRLSYMLADAQVSVLVTREHLLSRLGHGARKTVCLDRDRGLIDTRSREFTAVRVEPENPAYVIYTSGSTGKPKGVCVSHGALANHMGWMRSCFGWTAEHRVLQKTPFSFDASVWEFHAPLMSGGTLVIAQPGGHQDPGYMVDVIGRMNVNVLQLVPSLLGMLLQQAGFANCRTLQYVFCGGEKLPPELVAAARALLPGARFFNLFGPTEATIDATYWDCASATPDGIVSIGSPIANNQVYILDNGMGLVPAGLPGEIYIGGAGLARGYLGQTRMTAERFLPNPFGRTPGERIYRTGDKGRYFPGGAIEFLGRLDGQVKIRGFRIELGEIEAALASHDLVRAAVVTAHDGDPGGGRLAAYVVGDSAISISELRSHLARTLPEYMVPSSFVLLDALPLSPNGKIDRAALPAPDSVQCEPAAADSAPRTPTEQLLAEVWREILRIDSVGIHDNFFALGGHSLLVTLLISGITERTGVDIPFRTVFEHSTIAGLAEWLSQNDGQAVAAPAITRASRAGRVLNE